MRILLVPAVLATIAGCAWQPPVEPVPPPPAAAIAPPAPVVLAPPPPALAAVAAPVMPAPIAPAPAPVVAAPPVVPVAYLPSLTLPTLRLRPVGPLRLTLSNFAYSTAHVEAVITPFADCLVRQGTTPAEFSLPQNGTRILDAPVGYDICWRHEIVRTPGTETDQGPAGWSAWSRAYLTSGHDVDAQL